MRWRLEGNARELRVLLKERAVAQAELDRVRELLREMGVDDDDGTEEEDEDEEATFSE
jgi:ribosome assembly protein YihI (activator of Der GTPase)